MNVREYMTQTPEGCFELINGLVREPPTPGYEHQSLSGNIYWNLRSFLNKTGLGIALIAPLDVVLDEKVVVQPDLLFILNIRKSIIKEKNIRGNPDLVIEVVSPSSIHHDTVTKKSLYEKYGIPEYWIVYPDEKIVDVFVLKNGKYKLQPEVNESGKLKSSVLKGFSIELKKIFTF
ncbi:MAG: Uma2 family endonuclease [Bacteroidetes bacterium]|nr:Uma2 family endonuclease [Bacteroidota bacterium]